MNRHATYVFSIVIFTLIFSLSAFAQEVTLRYAFWGDPEVLGIEEEIIKTFMEDHPHIRVEPIATPWDDHHDRLLTMLAAGDAPDVMRIDNYFLADFAARGAMRAIDDFIERDTSFDASEYYFGAMEESNYAGRQWGLPWGFAPYFFMYNKDMFQQAGLDEPGLNWTIDDFFEKAMKLSQGRGVRRQYGWAGAMEFPPPLLPWIWSEGGALLTEDRRELALDRPESLKALQFQTDLIHEHQVAPTPDLLDDIGDTQLFLTGRVAMTAGMANSVVVFAQAPFNWDVTVHPGGDHSQTTIWKSNTIAIGSQTSHPEEAWEFAKYLVGPTSKGMELYTSSQRIPPQSEHRYLWDLYASEAPSRIEETVRAILSTHGRQLPYRPGWQRFIQELNVALEEMAYENAPAKDVIARVKPIVDDILVQTWEEPE